MKKPAVLFFFLALVPVLLAGFIGGALFFRWRMDHANGTYNTSTIIQQVQSLAELVTVKYVVEKIVILEDTKWYGENRVLLLAHGIVKAGIDLREMKAGDLRIDGAKITIKLPPEKITDAYLDEKKTQVIERTTGIIRQFDKGLEQTARKAALADIRSAARINGIIKDAHERAKEELTSFFKRMGFQEVEFE
ncbi:MAG: DUF4230 domain-containing protein [Verrucomicrobiota bacterium]